MTTEKRPVDVAYKSFLQSPDFVGHVGKGFSDNVSKKLSGKDWTMLEKLYKNAYQSFQTEEECNKAVADFLRDEWASGSSYVRSNPLKAFTEYAENILEKPSNIATKKEEKALNPDEIRAKRSDAYTNPDPQKIAEAEANSKKAQSVEAGKRAVEDYNADKNAGKDKVIPFDESTVAIGSADEGIGKLSDLSNHLVSILGLDGVMDTGKVKSTLERLKEESDYETYGDALKTASNIRELCKRIYKYEPKYRFQRNFVVDNDVLAQKVLNSGAGFWSRVSNVVTGGSKSGGGNEQELIKAYTSVSGQKKRLSNLTDDELIKLIEDIKAYYPKEVSWFKYVKGTLADANLTRRSVERANGYVGLWDKDAWGEVKKRLQNEGRPGDAISIADKLLSANLMPGCENGLNAIKLHMQALALSKGVNAGESGSINKGALNVGGKQ